MIFFATNHSGVKNYAAQTVFVSLDLVITLLHPNSNSVLDSENLSQWNLGKVIHISEHGVKLFRGRSLKYLIKCH